MGSKAAHPDRGERPQKMLLSADDFQRMGEAGIFTDKPRVELINGEIFTMSPFTPEHNSHVDKIAEFFTISLFGKARVRTQGSVRLDEFSEPEPDIAILRFDENYYQGKQVTAEDIFLLIEVSVNTLATDRKLKKEKYALAGIPEYWIVIPEKGMVESYQKPEDGAYREKKTYLKKDEWLFDAFNLLVKGSDLLI